MTTEPTNPHDDIKALAVKLDAMYEKLVRYLSLAEASPTNSLFIAGVKSSLEHTSRYVHKTNEDIERFILVVNEMKSMIEEIHVSMRLVRNRIYCLAGESEQMRAAEELAKLTRAEKEKTVPPVSDAGA